MSASAAIPRSRSDPREEHAHPLGLLRIAPGWVLLGLAGSVLLTLVGPSVGGGSVVWWFHPWLFSVKATDRAIFYVGVAGLVVAWLGIGRSARAPTSPRQVSLVAALWSLPLAIGVPLFSRDLYSYLAQGTVAHLGLSPYHAAPEVLARLGHQHVLQAVDPFWRHATAPYGPLFLGVISLIVGVTGSHLVAGALLVRAFDLVGLVLLAIFVPRVARRVGADPARAVWLAVASPVILLQLVAPAHNDLLMAGTTVAGVALAIDGRPLLGVVVCALAATIKLPALAAVLFIATGWIRTEQTPSGRLRAAASATAAAVATLAAVTLITGFGPGWVSTALFSTPARVKLAITPATDFSWTIAKLLGDVGVTVSFTGLQSVLRSVAFAASVIVALWLLSRTRLATVPFYLGLALIAFALGGPAVWPWYLTWGLVLLAATRPAQDSRLLVAGVVVASLLVKPGGILALPLGSSPFVVCAWLALIALLWHRWRRRPRVNSVAEHPETLGAARSALAEH
jgi:hypothetical protein